MNAKEYIVEHLISYKELKTFVWYGTKETAPKPAKLIIVPANFFDESVYGTKKTSPITPFRLLPDTDIPFLFGESRLEKTSDGKIILYADLVASAYFLLSRYEEIIKPECRDQHGRFLAKDSIVFQQGYGMRPLVDEWGKYLRTLLRSCGVEVPEEKKGFRTIYLTHDVDKPFYFWRKDQVIKQWIKNIIHHGPKIHSPLRMYLTAKKDPYYTFPCIINYDKSLQEKLGNDIVKSIYFLITADTSQNSNYCNIKLPKYKKMIKQLIENGATLGLHISYEGGADTSLIEKEIYHLPVDIDRTKLKSRHHYLRWQEPEMVDAMEEAGIKEDFSLGFADSVGFRVGTCRSYYFINPKTKRVTNILIHPMEIMDNSLYEEQYLNMEYNRAFELCKEIIQTIKHNYGELSLLFHNTSLVTKGCFNKYYGLQLYKELLDLLSTN